MLFCSVHNLRETICLPHGHMLFLLQKKCNYVIKQSANHYFHLQSMFGGFNALEDRTKEKRNKSKP